MQTTLENYLKAIFSICLTEQVTMVKVSQISKRLNISVPAVTDMIRKLQSEGYVKNVPYKGVSLTKAGRSLGCNMVRRHRLWETYLHLELGLPWDKVHDEAELLEHAGSDTLIETIEAKLNFPDTDPHGNPIPKADGSIPKLIRDKPLSECVVDEKGHVSRVVDLDKAFLQYIDTLGINLGDAFTVKAILSFDQSVLCVFDKQEVTFSALAAQHIYVR